ncbi:MULTISPECIES: hypothetical protein [Rhizobium]|nr:MULTISPECIES: hypothetical protein [Rhizobium]
MEKTSRKGTRFLECTLYPECDHTAPISVRRQ